MSFRRFVTALPCAICLFCVWCLVRPTSLSAQSTSPQNPPAATSTSKNPSAGQDQTGQLPPKEQPGVVAPGKTQQGEDKRVLGVLPNYRTAEQNAQYQPITPKQKLSIASKDSFDYPLMLLSTIYAGFYQLENSHPEFGQGLAGYGRRLGTTYADEAIGNMLTEGFMPIVFHEDPRYFRLAEGTKTHRALYALTRIFVTRTDAGGTSFNFAEVVGNGMAAGIGLSYYPDYRHYGDYIQSWGLACGTDAGSQVLKEFWPDVKRWWYVRHHKDQATP